MAGNPIAMSVLGLGFASDCGAPSTDAAGRIFAVADFNVDWKGPVE